LDFNEAKNGEVVVALAGPYANICTLLQTDSNARALSLCFAGQMLFLMPSQ